VKRDERGNVVRTYADKCNACKGTGRAWDKNMTPAKCAQCYGRGYLIVERAWPLALVK
jgi:DnaJ-class molecular chaperone